MNLIRYKNGPEQHGAASALDHLIDLVHHPSVRQAGAESGSGGCPLAGVPFRRPLHSVHFLISCVGSGRKERRTRVLVSCRS